MNASDLSRAAADLRPDRYRQATCRARQAMLMIQLLPRLDAIIEDAASAKVSAPGLLEIREWALIVIDDAAEQACAIGDRA